MTLLLQVTLFSGFTQEMESVSFEFKAGMVYGNEAKLKCLYDIIDQYKDEITTGQLPVYVSGYCAVLPNERENMNIAFIRANRVKTELIIRKGLLEQHFKTKNYATAHEENDDIVVVMLRIPAKEQVADAVSKPEPKPEPVMVQSVARDLPFAWYRRWPLLFDLRVNWLYDFMLMPMLGMQ